MSCLVEVQTLEVLHAIIHQLLRLPNKSSRKHIFMSFICLCRSKTRNKCHQCSSKANDSNAVNKTPQTVKNNRIFFTLLICSSSVDRQASLNIRLGVPSRKTHQRFSWIFLIGFFPVRFARDAKQEHIIMPRPPFPVDS